MFELTGIFYYSVVSVNLRKEYLYDNIKNASLTSDKEPNILMYETPSYVIIYRSCKLLNVVYF